MIISHPTLDGLRTTFSLDYRRGYQKAPIWWPKLATEVPSGSKSNTYGWLAKRLKGRKWVGPRVIQNLKEHAYQLANERGELTVEVDRDDIEDDNLGVYGPLFEDMGDAVAKWPDQRLKADCLRGNPVSFDGKTLFAHDHPVYNEAGDEYDNDFELELDAENFNTVWSTMAGYVGEDDEPLNVMPTLLIVAPQKRKIGLEILESVLIAQAIRNVAGTDVVAAAGATNVMKGWAELLVIPELADDPEEWFLGDTSKSIKPFVRQVRRAAQFVSRDNPTDPKVFDQAVFTYGADWRDQYGPTLPFLIARSKPAP